MSSDRIATLEHQVAELRTALVTVLETLKMESASTTRSLYGIGEDITRLRGDIKRLIDWRNACEYHSQPELAPVREQLARIFRGVDGELDLGESDT